MTNLLKKANDYMFENMKNRGEKYTNNYHYNSPIGWINDPNGFSMFNNEYHLFYQFYPYGCHWGPMHWGHAKTTDFISWETLPIALAPNNDATGNCGIFSGSGIEHEGKHYLMYTDHYHPIIDGHFIDGKDIRQTQAIAYSVDGIHYEKISNNPVISSELVPQHAKVQDIRDPKIWKKGEYFYCVLGSINIAEGGQVLLYRSKSIESGWEYFNTLIYEGKKLGICHECPDLFNLDGHDLLIMSPQYLKPEGYKYWNVHSAVYMVGQLNYETGEYTHQPYDQIDHGFDFYAPQTLLDSKGRRIMIAWLNMWERESHTVDDKWVGAMTLPRELKIINNKLIQLPVEEIKNYRQNEISYENVSFGHELRLDGIKGNSIELEMNIKVWGDFCIDVLASENNNERFRIMYHDFKKLFTVDRSQSGKVTRSFGERTSQEYRNVELELIEQELKLRIFVDKSSVEIFVNDGEYVLASNCYPINEDYNVVFTGASECKIVSLKKWDIKVK